MSYRHYSLPGLIAVLSCLMMVPAALGNREGNNWYFGWNAGITFNTTPPQALLDGVLTSDEGCASISDRDGNLLFYTNGRTVWNRFHTAMPNGEGLRGHASSVQSGIIIPQPGNPDRYYVFSVGASEVAPIDIHYSVVDMTLDGGRGDILEKNTFLLGAATEKITGVRHANGEDFWVVTHGQGNNHFYAYRIDADGITGPVVSSIGAVHPTGDFFASGAMKISPDGTKLAVAIRDAFVVELFDFDPQSGRVTSGPIVFPNPMRTYGIEFSPDNSRLYISSGNYPNTGRLEQYDLTAGSASAIVGSRVILGELFTEWWGALQLGPDGRIYLAKMDQPYLGVIERPNNAGTQAGFTSSAVHLGGRFSRLGLPNFLQSIFTNVDIAVSWDTACFGDTTTFVATVVQGQVDSLLWDFGDPATGQHNTASGLSVAHRYSAPGVYVVTVMSVSGSVRSSRELKVVVAEPPTAILAADTAVCPGQTVVLSTTDEFLAYRWSNGDTTRSIIATASDRPYVVQVMAAGGCMGTDSIMVIAAPVPVAEAGSDTEVCRGDTAQLQGTGEGRYRWSPATGLSCTDCPDPRAAVSETTVYTLTVTNKYGCSASDQVTVRVYECNLECRTLSGIINQYASVSDINAAAGRLVVDHSSGFGPGDTVLLIQMQGAEIVTSNTVEYGRILSYNGAGLHEYAVIRSVAGREVTLTAPLRHTAYEVSGRVQVVRVPYFDHATIVDTLTCPPWNGSTGGVLALSAGCLILDGIMTVDGKGFRGGMYENFPGCVTKTHNDEYISDRGCFWARKGEGIAGNGVDAFVFGRGAPANAGGGGNNHNAGGGGGGNLAAGGRGGLGYNGVSGTLGSASGTGGWALHSGADRVFLGGGGGAGHVNHNHGSAGAAGGGILLLRAGTLRNTGSGLLSSRGNSAHNDSSFSNPDGCGGGGAGGTIVLDVATVAEVTAVDVRGGNGGGFTKTPTSSGPGGGGSGGVVWLSTDSTSTPYVQMQLEGGRQGTASNGSFLGAQGGSPGVALYHNTPAAPSLCRGCLPVALAIEQYCGETVVTVADNAYALQALELDSAHSTNVELLPFGALPASRVVVRITAADSASSGVFTLIATNAAGKTGRIVGSVRATVEQPTISWDGRRLLSTPAAQYQWYYHGSPVYNGQQQQYTPTLAGPYHVRVTDTAGCTAESEIMTVAFTTVAEESSSSLLVYPNPGNGLLTLRLNNAAGGKAQVRIWDAVGHQVNIADSGMNVESGQMLDLRHLSPGLYTIVVYQGTTVSATRFIKL